MHSIQDECPEGVPFYSINDIFTLRNGYTPSKSNPDYWNGTDTLPWFRMEDIRKNGGILDHAIQSVSRAALKGRAAFPANSLIIATSATIGAHALITVPYLSNQRFTSLSLKPRFQKNIDMKFAYYYGFILDEWCMKNTTTSSFSSVNMSKFRRFRFPVPPMSVQKTIVQILDTFTSLENSLENSLEKELQARHKQYAYYRNQLLTFRELQA
ncbi:restriction endonuclease subunit S [Bifidobacterium sp. W8116]|uniref:Restriction endonuclease subunit S n=2 Tax=Bifidobacterium choladohabitans TaxID=2750947 RepID=A0ABS0QZI6_9BIFI|nr:restriction endonuclease subunit S [Bifidobacterium choladohabitans]